DVCVFREGHARRSRTAARLYGLHVTGTLSAVRSHWGVSALSTAAEDRVTTQNTNFRKHTHIHSQAHTHTHTHTHTNTHTHTSTHTNTHTHTHTHTQTHTQTH